MIRKMIHRRFITGAREGEVLLRAVERHRKGITDRYIAWNADRWPEIGQEPLIFRPVTHLLCWYHDWRTTWRVRP